MKCKRCGKVLDREYFTKECQDCYNTPSSSAGPKKAFYQDTNLVWYEHVWAGSPFLLLLIGGAIGGFCGGSAAFLNYKIFKGDQAKGLKFVFSGLISIAAFVVYMVLARAFLSTIHRH